MKKFVSFLCVVCLLVSLCAPVMAVSAKPTLTIDTVTADPGETVEVSVSISNNMGICGAIISFSYDSALTFNSITKGDALSSLAMTRPGQLSANPFKIVWDGMEQDTTNGVVLTFSVTAPSEPGTYAISAAIEEVLNGDLNAVNIEVENGAIVVKSQHEHSYTASITDPTCTEQGYTTYTCECGASYKGNYTNALGHKTELKNAREATCTAAGYTGDEVCTVCGETVKKGSAIATLGHDIVPHDAQAATCTEIGWEAYNTCSRCDYSTYVEIPATGHNYIASVTAPTCTTRGYTTYTCECGDNYVDDYTNALGHKFTDGICERCGAEERTPEIVDSGSCGTNITWTLNSNGMLTISGMGAMKAYYHSSPNNTPWYSNRESIRSVIIERGVTSIGEYAFYGCSNLQSVAIPDSVKSICSSAFRDCSSLTSVTIPCGVTSIGNSAFWGCDSLEKILVDAENAYYSNDEHGVLFNKEKTKLFRCPGGYEGSYTIPDSVTSLDLYAFSDCSSLTSVTIPNGVTKIDQYNFSHCSSLKSVVLPNGVTSICYNAFVDCSNLTNVTIPKSITNIDIQAFYKCISLTDVYYSGTEDEWNAITIKAYNNCLTNATRHYVDASHTHSYSTAVTAPTCTEKGYTTYTCSCGESYVDDYTDALGHNYENGVCTRCGAVEPNLNEGKISVSNERAKAGEEVTVSVSIENNPGIMVMVLGIDYDSSKLELTGFENAGLTGWAVQTSAVWIGDENSTYNGVILKLKFKVLENVEDGDIKVTMTYSGGDIANHDEEVIMPITEAGKITVYTLSAGDLNGDGSVNALDLLRMKKLLSGDTVELLVSADVNGDGSINALDLLRLKKFLAGDDVTLV